MQIDREYRTHIYAEAAEILINGKEKRADWLHETRLVCCSRTISDHMEKSWSEEELATTKQDPDHPINTIAEHLVIIDICQIVLRISPELGIAIMGWLAHEEPPRLFSNIIEEEKDKHGYSTSSLTYFARAIADALVAFRAA